MNATGLVNKPKIRRAPPKVSRIPANPASESRLTVPPFGGIPTGKAKSFTVPARKNMIAAIILSTLCRFV